MPFENLYNNIIIYNSVYDIKYIYKYIYKSFDYIII